MRLELLLISGQPFELKSDSPFPRVFELVSYDEMCWQDIFLCSLLNFEMPMG